MRRRTRALYEVMTQAGLEKTERLVVFQVFQGRSDRAIARRLRLRPGRVAEATVTAAAKLARVYRADPGLTLAEARDLLLCFERRYIAAEMTEEAPAACRPSESAAAWGSGANQIESEYEKGKPRLPAVRPWGAVAQDMERLPAAACPTRLLLSLAKTLSHSSP